MDKTLPSVTLNDVLDDKELLDVMRHALEPAIDAMIYRTAMIAKQMALTAIQEAKKA